MSFEISSAPSQMSAFTSQSASTQSVSGVSNGQQEPMSDPSASVSSNPTSLSSHAPQSTAPDIDITIKEIILNICDHYKIITPGLKADLRSFLKKRIVELQKNLSIELAFSTAITEITTSCDKHLLGQVQ